MHLNTYIPLEKVPNLVASHLRLQVGCYFTEVATTSFGDVATSEHISDHYWNSLSGFPNIDLESLEAGASPSFSSKRRKLAFYLDPTTCSDSFVTQLESASYSFEPEIWLGTDHVLPQQEKSAAIEIKSVTSENIAEFFLVFSQAFGGPATEKDGYGDIPPEYLAALEDSLREKRIPTGVTQHHFIGYRNSDPIACASIHYNKSLAGLYNVGTIPSEQGKGNGTALSLHALNHAFAAGVTQAFLQTQPNGSVQEFYEKLGCAKLFEAVIAFKP
jgi:ribosomal protein S18 acetylase RimI-like enzyme